MAFPTEGKCLSFPGTVGKIVNRSHGSLSELDDHEVSRPFRHAYLSGNSSNELSGMDARLLKRIVKQMPEAAIFWNLVWKLAC